MLKLINDIRIRHKKILTLQNSNNIASKIIYPNNVNKLITLYNKLLRIIYNQKSFSIEEILQLIKLINTRTSNSIDGLIDIRGDSLGFINSGCSIRYQIFKDSNYIKYNYYDNDTGITIENIYDKIDNMLNFEELRSPVKHEEFGIVLLLHIIESYIYDMVSDEGIKNKEILNRLNFREEQ